MEYGNGRAGREFSKFDLITIKCLGVTFVISLLLLLLVKGV